MPTWDEHGNEIPDDANQWDAQGRPIRPARRGQSRSLVEEVEQGLAAINRGIPFAQDLTAALGGVRSVAEGGSFDEGYQGQAQRNRDLTTDIRTRRPNAAAFLEGTGNAVPVIATMGAAAPQQVATQAAGRGFSLFANQSARAGAQGAAWGAGYGAGTGDAAPGMPLDERLDRGNAGGAMGGAFGLATPAAVNTFTNVLAPAWRGAANSSAGQYVGRAFSNMSGRGQQGAGMFGGQMFAPPTPPVAAAPPPSGPQIPRAAIETIDRLASRNRMSPQDVDTAFWNARENPQGQVTADIFGDAGVRTTRAIAQGPGQTGGRAAEVARERFQAAPDRIVNELNRRLAVAETPEQALRSLNDQYAQASANLYEPLFAQPMTPAARALADDSLRPFSGTPAFRDAITRAERIFMYDRANGMVEGALDDNYARYLHYIKMGLDDAVAAAPVGSRGAQATELSRIRDMRRRVVATIDNAVPGYQQARNQWSTIASAEEALADGRTLTNQGAGAIRERLAGMTQFERYHARVGFANEIAERMGLRGSVNGNRNVAEALGSPEIQRRVAAMFDSPEEAAAFLDTLNQQNMLMRNAGQWGGGSQTYSNAAHGADEALSTMADMTVSTAGGNPAGAVRRGLQGVANTATRGAIERANNARGEALLRRVDTEDSQAFAHAVVEELRRRAAERAAATAASEAGGVASGTMQGRPRE